MTTPSDPREPNADDPTGRTERRRELDLAKTEVRITTTKLQRALDRLFAAADAMRHG